MSCIQGGGDLLVDNACFVGFEKGGSGCCGNLVRIFDKGMEGSVV